MLDYNEYLISPKWQKKRSERLKIDNYKCQRCGRPMDLQVHHVNYERIGDENVYTDLITLCKYCHREIEAEKKKHKESLYSRYRKIYNRNRKLELLFCSEYVNRDYSKGGDLNLTNLNVIKTEWSNWLRKQGIEDPGLRVTTVIEYFRALRIKLIRSMADKGASPNEIMARGMSRNMVNKYYNNPALAENVIKATHNEMEEYLNAET